MNFPHEAAEIKQRIDDFFEIINLLFGETNKDITIDPKNNTLVFAIKGRRASSITFDGEPVAVDNEPLLLANDKVQLEQLSSGEKQLLLILTTVFLQEEGPSILLMDEPEISLHINWQDRLIEMIRKLNPNCQLILTTHSPNIFANGWEDKIVFIEDLEEE